jgi:DNA phosphorothioation-associated putative methyltransferase
MGTSDAARELYPELVAQLTVGKRLPEAVYLHEEVLPGLAPALQDLIAYASSLAAGDKWNVIKLATGSARISLLFYPAFLDDAFPALGASTVVDLESGTISRRTYDQANPPILHRKELLLPKGHALVPVASALTRCAEEYGLFEDANVIGHRAAWEARIARLRLCISGHTLLPVAAEPAGGVQRHKTALTRHSLSTPMQALWRHGFLDGTHTLFDYGCGRGDDLRALQAQGIDAVGWDPHYSPDGTKRESSIVNLGFVLNVIEDPAERAEALHKAWQLAKKLLVVSVLIGGRSTFERFRLFSDGVLTARNTFQRYFTAEEFRAYLDAQLGREPIMLAPGIAFVFRDDSDEQVFFARRASRGPAQPAPPQPPRDQTAPRPRVARGTARKRERPVRTPTQWEQHIELLDAFWARCLELGRQPEVDEFSQSADLRAALGSPATVLRALLKQRGEEQLDAARRARRDDLLVFLSLNLFGRRRSVGVLPDSVRRDIKAFFGSNQAAQAEAQALLFSAGRTQAVYEACVEAASRGLGFLDRDHDLQLHATLVNELPPLLRVYLGCASRLYGDIETADLVKVHIQSGKLSVLTYDDFFEQPLPRLIERVKINLRRQEIAFFEYGTGHSDEQLLYLKSRFIRPGFAHYDEQVRFDEELAKLDLDFSGFGPSHDAFMTALSAAKVRIKGFELLRA